MTRQATSTVRLRLITIALSCAVAGTAFAAGTPDPAKTRAYIDKAWTTLTRSQEDCAALVDTKVVGHPVLYVPAGQPVPANVTAIGKRCQVDVRPLPRRVEQLGDIDANKLPQQGLLYLPHPYVVPGGFFNEMYGWDSYFILLGLVADHKLDLAMFCAMLRRTPRSFSPPNLSRNCLSLRYSVARLMPSASAVAFACYRSAGDVQVADVHQAAFANGRGAEDQADHHQDQWHVQRRQHHRIRQREGAE